MIFIRRSPPARRYTVLRVSLFFLAAGLWLAGVATENRTVTAVAIGVAVVALLTGMLARRSERDEVEPHEDSAHEGERQD